MTYKYLASPYSHPDSAIRLARYRAVRDAMAWLLRHRHWAFSPIVHCHQIALMGNLPTEFEFWQDYNYAMIDQADGLLVLTLEGWKDSVGVQAEITYAADLGLPIRLLTFNTTTHPATYAFGKFMVVTRDDQL